MLPHAITTTAGISAPKPPAVSTYQLYPIAPDYQGPIELGRFQSGLKELPSVAMTKDKRAIGFVSVTVDVELKAPCWKLYLHSPYISTRSFIQADQSELSAKRLKTKEVTLAVFRSLLRISKSLILPKVLSPIGSFPQAVVVIIVYAFICFWIKMWQVPFLILGLVFINGLLSSGVERFSSIMTWNNCVSPIGSQYPFSKYFDDIASIDEKFLGTLDQLLLYITSGINTIEKVTNLTCFADVCISYVFYIGIAALSFVVSFLFGIFSTRFVVVLIGTIIMLTVACRSVLFNLKTIDDKDDAANTSPSIMDVLESLLVFCCRIPNDLDVEHRFIAKQSVVKLDGIEMQECKEQIKSK